MLAIAPSGAPRKSGRLVFALMAIMVWLWLLDMAMAGKPYSDQEDFESRTMGHLRIQHEEFRRRHAEAEAIYWEARAIADVQRKQLPSRAFTGTATDLGNLTRVWDYYTPDYNCPLLKQRVGRIGDGGKWVCGVRSSLLQTAGCLVYSMGSAGDTSFEEGMLNRTACEVHTFDPTLSLEVQAEVQRKVHSMEKLHFHPIGVGNPQAHATSALQLQTLEAIMAGLQHTWIDVLKMDIDGSEWQLLQDFYKSGAKLPATQVLVEFHFPGSTQAVWGALDLLLADKYRIFSVEPNYYCDEGCCARDLLEFAFIKVSDHGQICAPKKSLGSELDAFMLAEAC